MILRFEKDHRYLSNFYPSMFQVETGHRFATVEHFYQAMKTSSEEWFKQIMWAKSPGEAKKLGKQCPMVENWEQVKDSMMLTGLKHKFQQNKNLKEKLISTGTDVIIEGNTWGDSYWGYDLKLGYGQNRLGQLLMIVRLWAKEGKI